MKICVRLGKKQNIPQRESEKLLLYKLQVQGLFHHILLLLNYPPSLLHQFISFHLFQKRNLTKFTITFYQMKHKKGDCVRKTINKETQKKEKIKERKKWLERICWKDISFFLQGFQFLQTFVQNKILISKFLFSFHLSS